MKSWYITLMATPGFSVIMSRAWMGEVGGRRGGGMEGGGRRGGEERWRGGGVENGVGIESVVR